MTIRIIYKSGFERYKDHKLNDLWEKLKKTWQTESSTEVSPNVYNFKKDLLGLKNLDLESISTFKIDSISLPALTTAVNPVFETVYNNFNSIKAKEQLLTYKDGVLSIDIKQMSGLTDQIIHYIVINKIELAQSIGVSLTTAVGAGLLYRQVIKAYAQVHQMAERSENFEALTPHNKLKFMENNINKLSRFNKSGAVFLTLVFYAMISNFKTHHPIVLHQVNVTVNIGEGGESSTVLSSIFPIFTSLKNRVPK